MSVFTATQLIDPLYHSGKIIRLEDYSGFIISFILSLHQRVTGLIVCRYFCRMLPFLYYLFPALYRLCTILANLASTITHRITTINLESK